MEKNEIVPAISIESRILRIRKQNVMLDEDLAILYGVETRILNRNVKRNIERFPDDFMFQLSMIEFDDLKSQFGISSWGGRRTAPFVFTRDGIAMLSSVLNSHRAIQVNIQIIRTFNRIRDIMQDNQELRRKMESLESNFQKHDKQIQTIFDTIKKLIESPSESKKKNIGFDREKL
jgi:phage regulator Rha-like protein